MPSIYEPAEDSYLLSSVLKKEIPQLVEKNSELKFLEIGSGSGVNLETAFSAGVGKGNIIGSDINEKAVEHCHKLGFDVINSNLFQNIKGKFDLIIFNPPTCLWISKNLKNLRLKRQEEKKEINSQKVF